MVSGCLALCLAAGLASSAAAADDPADEKRDVDKKISRVEGDLHETSKQLQKAYTDLRDTRAKLPGAQEKARVAAAAQRTAQGAYEEAVTALDVAKANERKATKELKDTSKKIERSRKAVAAFAGEVYQQQGIGTLSVVVGAETPGEVVDRMIVSESVTGTQNSALEELNTSRADLVSQEDHLKALKKKTQKARDKAATALTTATKAREEADTAASNLKDLETRQTSQAKTLRDERAKDQRRLQGLQTESNRLGKILQERARKARIREARIKAAREAEERRLADARRKASRQTSNRSSSATDTPRTSDPNPAPPSSSGVLAAPINAPVTSEYGLRFHPVLNYWRLHAGRDYGGPCGAPVYAAEDGTIISAGVAGGYGNQIVIDHGVRRGVSLATTYNHLQSFARTSGRVSRGQLIGYEGTTGLSTGCHLHFETWENGTAVDPRRWL